MMRIFSIVLALVLTASLANAQSITGNVEFEATVDKSRTIPEINVYAHGPLKGKFGWTLWSQASNTWGESLGGLTFAPTKWMEVSSSLGVEKDKNPMRYKGTVWVGKSNLSFLSIQENGGSGHWQKNVGVLQVTKTLGVGVLQQSFVGAGPYAEIKAGKLLFWGAYAVKDNRGLLTARYNF